MKKNGTIVTSTLILTGAAIVARVFSMYYRAALSKQIGAEGMGLFELIFSVYLMVVTLAYSGINIAVSKLAAQAADSRVLLKTAFKIILPMAFLTGTGLFFGADLISARLLGDIRAASALKMLAPSVPFMSVSACINAYFIGTDKVIKPASGQVLEQFIRLCIILGAIEYAKDFGVGGVCTAAAFGMTVGEIVSCSYAAVLYFFGKKPYLANRKNMTRKILAICIPVAVGNYIGSAMGTCENLLLPKQLYKCEGESALATYGLLQGMALPLIMFPSTLISSLSSVVMPRAAAAKESGEEGALAGSVISFTLMCSVFVVAVFAVFPYQLGMAVYQSYAVGRLIEILAYLCPFMYLESVISSMLVGLGLQVKVLTVNACESVCRILIILFLIPTYGITAYLATMAAGSVITTCIKLYMLSRASGLCVDLTEWVLKPAACAMSAGVLARLISGLLLWQIMPAIWALITGIAIMLVLFLGFMRFTETLKIGKKEKDVKNLSNCAL